MSSSIARKLGSPHVLGAISPAHRSLYYQRHRSLYYHGTDHYFTTSPITILPRHRSRAVNSRLLSMAYIAAPRLSHRHSSFGMRKNRQRAQSCFCVYSGRKAGLLLDWKGWLLFEKKTRRERSVIPLLDKLHCMVLGVSSRGWGSRATMVRWRNGEW